MNCGAVLGAPTIEARPPKPVVARPRETQPIAAADVAAIAGEPPPAPVPVPTPVDPYAAAHPPQTQDPGAIPPPVYPDNSQPQLEIHGTTYQTPAAPPGAGLHGDSFVAGGGGASQSSSWLLPLVALLLGVVIGALITYLVIPATEYVVLDPSAEPSPTPTEASVAGIVIVPIPRGRAGPIIPPGPDYQTQVDLRNALIASKRYYLANGKYTQETEEMAKIAPEVSWEPGITPSRPGVVAISLCGPQEASTAVILQALSPTGKYFGVFDQPSGPAAGVYYAMGQAAFQCPNAMPPASPWQRSLSGWGISEPTVQPSPTQRDDRNDPVPDYPPPTTRQPTPSPTPTGYPASPSTGAPPFGPM